MVTLFSDVKEKPTDSPSPGDVKEKKLSSVRGAVLTINREVMLELMENKEQSLVFLLFYYE